MKLFGWYIGREPEPTEVVREIKVPFDRFLMGTPAPTTLYQARDDAAADRREKWLSAKRTIERSSGNPYCNLDYAYFTAMYEAEGPEPTVPEWHKHCFLTCEQAFAECPGAKVISIPCWRVGNDYVTGLEVRKLHVAPKPKVDKG